MTAPDTNEPNTPAAPDAPAAIPAALPIDASGNTVDQPATPTAPADAPTQSDVVFTSGNIQVVSPAAFAPPVTPAEATAPAAPSTPETVTQASDPAPAAVEGVNTAVQASTDSGGYAIRWDDPDAVAPVPHALYPADTTLVDVPNHVAEQLPANTAVTMTTDGALVATVLHEGKVHTIYAEISNELAVLVAAVTKYFGDLY
jgi:hypothetical protein